MKKNFIKAITYMTIFFVLIFIITFVFHKRNNDKEDERIYLSHYLNTDEINFILNNKIDIDALKPYLDYKNFSAYNFYHYEELRDEYNLTFLESINYYNNPHYYKFYKQPKSALFINTPLMLVNKCYAVDRHFVPDNLVNVKEYDIDFIIRRNEEIMLKKIVLDKYQLMFNDAKSKNIELTIFSGYRSYDKQEHLYYNVYKQNDTISAKPGHSEHHTGYAIDISIRSVGLDNLFEETKSYEWLLDNSYKYGFILRYPKGKEDVTGYHFEPWHFRYVGNIASDIYYDDITLEEYIFSNLEI